MNYHFIIGGGGIVGLSTAWHLQQHYPDRKLLLLEKESALARQQAKNSASSMEFPAGGSGDREESIDGHQKIEFCGKKKPLGRRVT